MYYIVITPYYPTSNRFNGSFVHDQVKAIRASKLFKDVIVFKTSSKSKSTDNYYFEGETIYNLVWKSLPAGTFPMLYDAVNYNNFKKCLNKLNIGVGEIKVVHIHSERNLICGVNIKKENSNITTLMHHHDPDICGINTSSLNKFRFHLRYVINYYVKNMELIDGHVCISKKVLNDLINFPEVSINETYLKYINLLKFLKGSKKINIKKTYLLHNGVDVSKFFKKDRSENRDKFVIGCVANFLDWKDQLTLIKAVDKIIYLYPQLQVIFIGSGPKLNECKKFVSLKPNLKESIIFKKEINHKELNHFFNGLDLFILPSFFEGFGCVFLEAFACGVPFMTCRHQGIEDYIPDEIKNDFLFSPQDFDGLSRLIANFIDNEINFNLRLEIDIQILVKNFLIKLLNENN
jgi:glycosyltransferase involved in cell wall biosynthesis